MADKWLGGERYIAGRGRGGGAHMDVSLFAVAGDAGESILDFCVTVDAHIPLNDSTCSAKSSRKPTYPLTLLISQLPVLHAS
jgi:hypothetical protein